MPWRVQKIEEEYPDIEYFLDSLPPPPEGYSWENASDKSWLLKIKAVQDSSDAVIKTSSTPLVIEHVILPNDTIQGICLRYRVNITDVRRANYFSGNNIRGFKSLQIPVQPGVPFEVQTDSKEIILQKFRNITNENSTEAKIYLEEKNWNLEDAVLSWKEDTKWYERHKTVGSPSSVAMYSGDISSPEPKVVSPAAVRIVDSQQIEPERRPLLGIEKPESEEEVPGNNFVQAFDIRVVKTVKPSKIFFWKK